jgi:hypothetical protein
MKRKNGLYEVISQGFRARNALIALSFVAWRCITFQKQQRQAFEESC